MIPLSELVQTHDLWQWLFVAGALALLALEAGRSWRAGAAAADGGPVTRVLTGLQRRSRLQQWAAAGVTVALWALGVALIGFMWDVAWHADTGRDKELFTVPHMLILIGLFGIFAAGLLSIAIATRTRAEAGWSIAGRRIPYSAVPLTLLGFGALAGFPLDDYWHAVYGIDVTMWSPTHLMMIGGASLTPLALWLMVVEGGGGPGRSAFRPWIALSGAVLLGLSTLQLEYDMGIPQWQLLFHPALLAAAAAIGLTAARAAIGRGGALMAAVLFIVIRGVVAALIGPGLGHTLPRFPLYLVEAGCVELAFAVLPRRRPVLVGLVAGGLIGTFGLAAEWGWTQLWYPHPWPANLLNDIWIAVVVALCGGVVGIAAGRVLARQRAGVPAVAVAGALAIIGGLLAWHLPARSAPGASATVSTRTVGAAAFTADANGQLVLRRNVSLDLTVQPAAAARQTDWFTVVAWQGRAPVRVIPLLRTGDGRYRASQPIPVGGNWKSLVFLARGDEVAAVPVAFPPDPEYGLPGIEPPQSRTEQFVPAGHWLMRETHGGVIWPALLAIVAFAFFVILWVVNLCVAYWRFSLHPTGEELTFALAGSRVQGRAVPG